MVIALFKHFYLAQLILNTHPCQFSYLHFVFPSFMKYRCLDTTASLEGGLCYPGPWILRIPGFLPY